jgi:hypothetical protein
MPEYRIYALTERLQIINPPAVLECGDDAEAIDLAREAINGHDLEVWEHKRFVARIRSIDLP